MKKVIFILITSLLFNFSAWSVDKTHEKFRKAGNLLFISAQVPVNEQGELISFDVESQIKQTFENLVSAAQEGEATIEEGKIKDAVQLNVYLKDISSLATLDKYMLTYLTGKLPTRTPLAGIDYGDKGFLVVMDAVVELPK